MEPRAIVRKLLKTLLLVVGTYLGTLLAAGVAAALGFVVVPTQGCRGMGDALVILWVVIGLVFCAGLAVGSALGGRLELGLAAHAALTFMIAVLLVASYVGIAFGLMIAFNC